VISKLNFQRLRKGALKYLVLECLNEKPMHAYEIIKVIENKFQGYYRPSTGSIYPILKNLLDSGYIQVEIRDGKKMYKITDSGKKHFEEFVKNKSEVLFGDKPNLIRPILEELLKTAFLLYENKTKINEVNSQKILSKLSECREELKKILS